MAKDLRYQRTEKAIKRAFLQLLKSKPYEKIKLNEIIELAEISRNAFYLHYYSKDELLDNMIDSYVTAFTEGQNKILQKYPRPRPLESAEECLREIIHPFYENRETSVQLVKIDYVIRRLSDKLADYYYAATDKSLLSEREQLDLKMFAEYRAYGLIGMLGFILENNVPYTEEALVSLLHSINIGETLQRVTPWAQPKENIAKG